MLHNKRFAAGYVPRHQKTYLSRELTRAMAIDHPIGDPHGGPAYGERNDPISATVAIGTMFAASSGAIAAGTIAAMTLAEGLMFAGAALSLVGNISGNKTISRIGMVVGIAGGVGALSGMGSATLGDTFGMGEAASGVSGASGAPGPSLSETPNIADAANAPVAPPISTSLPQGVDLPPLVTDNLSAAQTPVSPTAAQAATPVPSSASAPLSQTASPSSAAVPAGTSAPAAAGVSAPTAPSASTTNLLDSLNINPTDMRLQAGTQVAPMGKPPGFFDSVAAGNYGDAASAAWTGIKDLGGSFMDLAKTNPGAAYMLGQGVSSVGDVLSGKAGAQINALEAQGELSKAQADKLRFEMEEYKRKLAQRNANYTNVANPLSTWKPNFQTTMTPQPSSGLIGGAMQPTPGG